MLIFMLRPQPLTSTFLDHKLGPLGSKIQDWGPNFSFLGVSVRPPAIAPLYLGPQTIMAQHLRHLYSKILGTRS